MVQQSYIHNQYASPSNSGFHFRSSQGEISQWGKPGSLLLNCQHIDRSVTWTNFGDDKVEVYKTQNLISEPC